MEKLLEILHEIDNKTDFENETDLIEKGILDSMTIVRLAAEINEEFDVEIKVTDITPENFNSAKSMMAMILRLEDEE